MGRRLSEALGTRHCGGQRRAKRVFPPFRTFGLNSNKTARVHQDAAARTLEFTERRTKGEEIHVAYHKSLCSSVIHHLPVPANW